MSYRERLKDIANFLRPYEALWQHEIMLMYPAPLEGYPTEWLAELSAIKNKEDVIELEKKNVQGLIHNPELLDFYERIEELTRFPLAPTHPAMPRDKFTFLYMIPKKQYEIENLAPFVNQFYHHHQLQNVIDIGGGVGFLAQSLNNCYELPVTSLDMDEVLQKTGRERHEKNAKNPLNKVKFVLVKVHEDSPELTQHLSNQSLTVGLHTCGALANDQIKASARFKSSIINFGCCYYKMGGDPQGQNISKFAQELPHKVEMSKYALTLSTRAHRKMNGKDYDFKLKVKYYRYAFHILLQDEYQIEDPMSLGNSSPQLYAMTFADYALEQLRRIEVTPKHSFEELNAFFEDSQRQELIWQMLAAGLIRNALGRLLEVYILIDRALYLEEHGYEVELLEFFDEEQSPRNIGLVAHLPKL